MKFFTINFNMHERKHTSSGYANLVLGNTLVSYQIERKIKLLVPTHSGMENMNFGFEEGNEHKTNHCWVEASFVLDF